MKLLEVTGLRKDFPAGRSGLLGPRRFVHAVNGIDFAIAEGETFALVGESGCGKSTTGRLLLGLETPTAGTIRYRGTSLDRLSPQARRLYRRRVQVVFQDSNASLNPRRTLGQILGAALRVTRGAELPQGRVPAVAAALLEDVGLTPADTFLGRFPHELSGGQRQRVGIARALAPEPELIIADEPVSALDISVRAQILTLLDRLQRERALAYLFISHDLAVVRATAQRVGVMYLGALVEQGPVAQVFERHLHPYTEVLIEATPQPRPGGRPERLVISGDVPSPQELPPGCPFHTRCPLVIERCRSEVPALRPLLPDHLVSCHRAEERLEGLELTEGDDP